MKQDTIDMTEGSAFVVNSYKSLNGRSHYRGREEFDSLNKKAEEYESSENFEAAKTYIKSAELADSHRMIYFTIAAAYERAANCFLRIHNSRGELYDSIELCLTWGYRCDKELGGTHNAEALYELADTLRAENKISHSCPLMEFVESKYGGNILQVGKELGNVILI
ncbi:hypothetical protein RF11_01593 [Thelohanellus kitauei]|uniref:Uncharacterized protein n=1 Tax=Thelohanellus kitauei TaxID=669202 RepID=A0A0C2MWJ5_THEKT|nr:hypothetical protein RF11_01593 [Thelohanellus kitauei]